LSGPVLEGSGKNGGVRKADRFCDLGNRLIRINELPRRSVCTQFRDLFRKRRAQIAKLARQPPPVNVVLLPMEGDPAAPTYFWRLAQATGGAFLSPPRDWP